ncbi:vacuolar protein sorting-associated protein 41 homolog [Photinus pyralis]|nr:vacuolar protein sorting-associated protein 41 homolog [Photinus pyralis]
MLRDYNLQVSVQEGCKKILVSDYFNLHNKLVRSQQRGVGVIDEMVCSACHRSVITRDVLRLNNIVVYNCKHCFHEQCVGNQTSNCGICHPTKNT